MSRFFFHIHDGVSVPDEVGQDLPDLDAVRREAVSRAGRALRDDPGQFWAGEDWSIDVRNEHDVILLTLQFLATEAPALDGRGRPPAGRAGRGAGAVDRPMRPSTENPPGTGAMTHLSLGSGGMAARIRGFD